MKKLTTILLLTFLLSGIAQGAEFKKGICSSELIMTQNLKAPKTGERYVKNGRYHWYTKSTVREAHILQKHLNRLGFNAGKVDGIIGPNTKGAILRMQKFLGTKQDGYVGPKTRALLNNSCGDVLSENNTYEKETMENKNINLDIHSVLEIGVSDKVAQGDVLKLQKFLKLNGYEIKYLDGIFGNEVKNALKKFTKKELGIEKEYFDPRWFLKENNQNKENWKPFLIKEYLGYGKFDWFYLDFPFDKKDINSVYCGKLKKDYVFKNGKIIFPISKNGYGKFTCEVNVNINGLNKSFDVVDVYFRTVKRPTTKVTLTKKYASKPNTEISNRIAKERKMLSEIYKKADRDVKFNSPFINPLDTELISPFGKVRIFNDGRKSVHSGTDFRARTPIAVKSVNDGVVVLANFDLYYCGKGVIINHGMNIFTTYCHLSENKVKIGDKVARGQIIGLTGMTGRVSGPHLHLSTKYNGGYIDFEDLKKKSEILK